MIDINISQTVLFNIKINDLLSVYRAFRLKLFREVKRNDINQIRVVGISSTIFTYI